MPAPSASRRYEPLVADITRQPAAVAGVDTESLRHDKVVQGKAATDQLDVGWDFRDAAGSPRRVVFEAKQYRRPVRVLAAPAPLHDAGRWVADVVVSRPPSGTSPRRPLTITVDGVITWRT